MNYIENFKIEQSNLNDVINKSNLKYIITINIEPPILDYLNKLNLGISIISINKIDNINKFKNIIYTDIDFDKIDWKVIINNDYYSTLLIINNSNYNTLVDIIKKSYFYKLNYIFLYLNYDLKTMNNFNIINDKYNINLLQSNNKNYIYYGDIKIIPKIIHQIWVGPNEIPEKSKYFIQKIKQLHPNYEYKLWIDNDINSENFLNYKFIVKTSNYAQKADIMRYEILYRYGGIYLDIDFEILQNLDNLINGSLVVCNEDEHINKYMSIGFIASTVNNSELLNCINNINTINWNMHVNEATGPYYFRKCINLENANVLKTKNMYPIYYTEKNKELILDDDIYGIHHWDKNW